jgi:hypothetical protein
LVLANAVVYVTLGVVIEPQPLTVVLAAPSVALVAELEPSPAAAAETTPNAIAPSATRARIFFTWFSFEVGV